MTQCGIGNVGQCLSLSGLSSSSYEADVLFSSANDTYCAPDDATCLDCQSEWSMNWNESGTVCYGTDACVCARVCESEYWQEHVLAVANCGHTSVSSASSSGSSGNSYSGIDSSSLFLMIDVAFMALVAGIAFRIISVLVFRCIARRRSRAAGPIVVLQPSGRQRRRTRREPTTGPLLSLEGWRSYQEKLIGVEIEQLERITPAVNGEEGERNSVDSLGYLSAQDHARSP